MVYTTYAIYDPRSLWPVYVGQTKNFEQRKSDHLTTHRERKKHPPGSREFYLKALHKARLEPRFMVLEVVETESESLKSETKWIQKYSEAGFPLLNRWEEHKEFVVSAPDELQALVFKSETNKRRAEHVGKARPNKNRTGYRLDVSKDVTIEGPITVDLLPPKAGTASDPK
ncbi:MAG: GIY-YIG nuclease family protein [Pseudomonadota bacterium]